LRGGEAENDHSTKNKGKKKKREHRRGSFTPSAPPSRSARNQKKKKAPWQNTGNKEKPCNALTKKKKRKKPKKTKKDFQSEEKSKTPMKVTHKGLVFGSSQK